MSINNLRIAKKLLLGFGTIIVLLLLLATVAWWELAAINQGQDATAEQAQKIKKLGEVSTDLDAAQLKMWGLVTASDAAEKQADIASVAQLEKEFKKDLDELKAGAKHQEDKDLLAKLEEAVASINVLYARVIEMSRTGDAKAQEVFETEGEKLMNEKVDPAVEALVAYRGKRIQSIEAAAEDSYFRARWVMGIGSLAAFGLAAILGTVVAGSLTVPIKECVAFTGLLAQGDFSKDVHENLRQRGDEMGDLARAFHTLVANTRKLLGEVTSGVQTIASSATELSAVSNQTTHAVKSMSEKTCTVAAAAEEASANTVSVAASMEQASTNLASIACATEEMSATVGEIATNSEKARTISGKATAQAESVSARMQQLGEAAREIGKFTEIITGISSQTNLLALNATIEAASAGEAGRGFAVVANEIKELARQTATATENIKEKISGVQTSTGGAISEIEKIAGVINEVGEIIVSIAAAIEEQSSVTKNVSRNIAQASAGVKDANERIAQTATVSKSMAGDLAGVNAAVSDIRQGGEHVQTSTVDLSRVAEQLKSTAAQFKV